MEALVTNSAKIWLAGLGLSLVLHAAGFGYITSRQLMDAAKPAEPVKVRIVEKKPEPPPEKKAAPPPPKPEKKKPKPKPKPKKIATERKPPKEPPKEPVKPIQGLDKTALTKDPNAKNAATR
jgi:outer membrane biosynthesis protein TonB